MVREFFLYVVIYFGIDLSRSFCIYVFCLFVMSFFSYVFSSLCRYVLISLCLHYFSCFLYVDRYFFLCYGFLYVCSLFVSMYLYRSVFLYFISSLFLYSFISFRRSLFRSFWREFFLS